MTRQISMDGTVLSVPDDDPRVPQPTSGVPQAVTPLQGKLALNAAGLLPQVEATVASADKATQIWYAEAPIWERHNSIILGLAAQLQLSDAQLDGLFTQAAMLGT